MSFEARWTSLCAECLEDILPGQMIRTSGEGGYAHVMCPTGEDIPVKTNHKPRGVCPNCHLELTAQGICGECGWLGY